MRFYRFLKTEFFSKQFSGRATSLQSTNSSLTFGLTFMPTSRGVGVLFLNSAVVKYSMVLCLCYDWKMEMEDSNKSTFSFGFSKRAEVKKLQLSAIKDVDHGEKEETDFLVSVENNEIKRYVV